MLITVSGFMCVVVKKIEDLFVAGRITVPKKPKPFPSSFPAKHSFSKMSSTVSVPRFASLYKNLKPSSVAVSAYSLRKEKAEMKAAAIKAAESAIASKLVTLMSLKAHEAALKNVQDNASDYDECDYEDYIDHIYDNDW